MGSISNGNNEGTAVHVRCVGNKVDRLVEKLKLISLIICFGFRL